MLINEVKLLWTWKALSLEFGDREMYRNFIFSALREPCQLCNDVIEGHRHTLVVCLLCHIFLFYCFVSQPWHQSPLFLINFKNHIHPKVHDLNLYVIVCCLCPFYINESIKLDVTISAINKLDCISFKKKET